VKDLIKVTQRITHWFGGFIHGLYAVFQRNSTADNRFSGRALTLIRPSEKRMGGHFIAFMRLARLKRPILDTLTCVECVGSKLPIALTVILQGDDFWTRIIAIHNFTTGMMRVLRTADRATACMHLLCYFVMKAMAHMINGAEELNRLFDDRNCSTQTQRRIIFFVPAMYMY
jgi:hypothetical protein